MEKHVPMVCLMDSYVVDIGVHVGSSSTDDRQRDDQMAPNRSVSLSSDRRNGNPNVCCIWVQVNRVVVGPPPTRYLRADGWLL